MFRHAAEILLVFFLILPLAGCGGRNVKPPVSAETIREQYEEAIEKLRANDLKGAEQGFQNVIGLDSDSPYGYAGMGLLELARTDYDEALKNADRAIKLDASVSDAHAVRGRVLSIRKKGRRWFEEAMSSLGRAMEIAPEDQRAIYYAGECCLAARMYEDARHHYTRAAELSGPYDAVIAERIELMDKIIAAGELSEKGSIIALDDKIDRADLAELLVSELGIAGLIRERRPDLFGRIYQDDMKVKHPPDAPRDVSKNRSRNAVQEVLALDLRSLDIFPDGYFYPDRLVTRARMAGVMQEALAMLKNGPMLETMYIGADSPYYDVHPEYYAFNAVMLCTRCGIMAPENDNARLFDPEGAVSGIDAILMIRALVRGLDIPLPEFYKQAGYPLPESQQ